MYINLHAKSMSIISFFPYKIQRKQDLFFKKVHMFIFCHILKKLVR